MSLWKKVVAGVVVTALIAGAAAGGLYYMRQSSQQEVLVVKVSSLAEEYYSQDTMLEGYVATNVSQHVSVDDDMVIQEVFVEEGDSVNTGDTLVTFDMTLVEMELNIARLKRQKLEQDLNSAVRRLNSLRNGGPIDETDGYNPGNADNLSGLDEMDELAYAGGRLDGAVLAAAMHPWLLGISFVEDMFGDGDSSQGDGFGAGDGSGTGDGFGTGDDFGSGNSAPVRPRVTPTPTPALPPDTDYFDPYTTEGIPDLFDGAPEFYETLDGDTEPFCGTGTEEDPYIFLCSSLTGSVKVMGSFFNKMAGYSEDGSTVLKPGGYWYQLEFHQDDIVMNFLDRKESCIGYYLMEGRLLEAPAGIYAYLDFTLEGASTYDEEPEDPGDMPSGEMPTISRAEAIQIQKDRIASLQLDIQESDIDIEKLEKKVERKVIYSKLDGTVSHVGDALAGTTGGGEFITIKSKEGYYVTGSVSELMLDQVKEGTLLNCMSYSSGSFEAKVMDVSDYPVSSGSYFGEGNPNVSYYTYSASIEDDSIQLGDMDWLNVTLKNNKVEEGSLVISKAFVRSENGQNYVYKDENGVLKKQILSVGGNVNGGYSVLIRSGLTTEDLVAFPYGDAVKEGAKTRTGTMDELYGY